VGGRRIVGKCLNARAPDHFERSGAFTVLRIKTPMLCQLS
jgi:hypothetical protein